MASGSDMPAPGSEPSRPPQQTPQPPQNPQYDFCYLYQETPKRQTPDERAPNLREKIFAVIGYATCLLTGMMHVEYILQAFHIVPRSLHNTHWEEYSCFRDAIGIVVNGERVLNLNNSRNVDMASSGLHKFFDGPSVLKDKLGQGEFALPPEDLKREVEYVTAPENVGKSYEELYPDVAHRLVVYGFSNKHKFSWGRYPSPDRTYEHLDPEKRTLLEDYVDSLLSKIDIHGLKESLKRKGVYIGSFAPPPTSDADPTIHVLRAGRNYTVVSHINPVFAIYDYLLKMKFRVYDKESDPSYIQDIPPEDVEYFRNVMWPKLQHWVKPQTDAQRIAIEQSRRQHPMKLRKTTKKAATAAAGAPAPRMAPPLAQRAVTHDGHVPTSPLTPLSSSPNPAERTATESPAAGAHSSIMGTLALAAMAPASPTDGPAGNAASFDPPSQPMTVRIAASNPCYSDPPEYDLDDDAPEDEAPEDDTPDDFDEDEHFDDEGSPGDYELFFDEEAPVPSTPTATAGDSREETTPTPASIPRELSTASVTAALADIALSGDPSEAPTPQPDLAQVPSAASTSSIPAANPPAAEEHSQEDIQGHSAPAFPPMTTATPQAAQVTSTLGNDSSQDAPPPPTTTDDPEIQKRPATRRRTRATAARANPAQDANATPADQPPTASTSTRAPSDPPARNLRSRGKTAKRERDDDEEDDGDDAPEPPKAKRARKAKPKPKTKDKAPVKRKGKKKKDDPDPSDDEGPPAGPSKKGKGKGRA